MNDTEELIQWSRNRADACEREAGNSSNYEHRRHYELMADTHLRIAKALGTGGRDASSTESGSPAPLGSRRLPICQICRDVCHDNLGVNGKPMHWTCFEKIDQGEELDRPTVEGQPCMDCHQLAWGSVMGKKFCMLCFEREHSETVRKERDQFELQASINLARAEKSESQLREALETVKVLQSTAKSIESAILHRIETNREL